jgi:hypothetical protein
VRYEESQSDRRWTEIAKESVIKRTGKVRPAGVRGEAAERDPVALTGEFETETNVLYRPLDDIESFEEFVDAEYVAL